MPHYNQHTTLDEFKKNLISKIQKNGEGLLIAPNNLELKFSTENKSQLIVIDSDKNLKDYLENHIRNDNTCTLRIFS